MHLPAWCSLESVRPGQGRVLPAHPVPSRLCVATKFKFFCYDVVCNYWPFAKDVGTKLETEDFKKHTEEMVPFLSRFHGKTHTMFCQVTFVFKKLRLFPSLFLEQLFIFSFCMEVTGRLEPRQQQARQRNRVTQKCLAMGPLQNT